MEDGQAVPKLKKVAPFNSAETKPATPPKKDKIFAGQRNSKLASIACSMRLGGAKVESILDVLRTVNAQNCSPPLTDKELESIARSIGHSRPATPECRTSAMEPELIAMSQVQIEQVEWLWKPYLPVGKITLIEGDPGQGKTFVSLAICAGLTRGFVPSTGERPIPAPMCSVLYMTAEDGIADTLKPRFEKMEGNSARFFVLRGGVVNGKSTIITLLDIPVIEKALERTSARLLVVDPIQAYLGADVDMHRANEVRPVLAGIAALAERQRVAVILIRHLSKAQQSRTLYRGLGSIDLAAAARSVILVGANPNNPEERAIAQVKNSLAPEGSSLGFRISEPEGFAWTGESDLSAHAMLAEQSSSQDMSATEEAVEFIRATLANGPKCADEVQAEAKKASISASTLRRASEGLVRKRYDGKQRRWMWHRKFKNAED